jgi:beta propeller repeat protein
LLVPASALPLAAVDYLETPIVTDAADQINPAISGDAVVWQDYRNKSSGCPTAQNCLGADIYHKDLSSGVERKLTLTASAMDPAIDGDLVVWRDWMTGKIVAHDLTSGAQQNTSVLTGFEQMTSPAVSDGIVVWTDFRNSSEYGDIYMRDMSAPADEPVEADASAPGTPSVKKDKRNPDISGDIVVWEDMRNAFQDELGWWHNPDIYMKDLSTGVVSPVCDDLGDQYNPVVSGDKVLWSDHRNGNWDVYMYNISTGVETRLTDNSFDQSWPAVDGDYAVWKDTRSGNEDVFVEQISTGAEKAITGDAALQKLPTVDGDRIVWMDNRNGNWDIFMAERDTVAPVITAAGPGGIIDTTSTTLTAAYADGETGIDTGTVAVSLDGNPAACSVDESGASCPVSGLADGAHTMTVDVSDVAGNPATTWSGGFTVDTAGPQIISLTAIAAANSDTVDINAAYGDAGIGVDTGSVAVTIDGNPVSGCTITESSSLGGHTVELSLSDAFGHPSSASTSFDVVDTIAPSITGTAPTGTINSADLVISADFDDQMPGSGVDPASVSVILDGSGINADCEIAADGIDCSLTGVADGGHDVGVQVSDYSGNPNSSAWSFNVSATGPAIDQLQPAHGSVVNDGKATISARVTDPEGVDSATIRFYLDGVDLTAGITMSGDIVSYIPSTRLSDGAHTARVTAEDNIGHASDQSWSFEITSPSLNLTALEVYWEDPAAFMRRELTIDYRIGNPGTGTCINGQVPFGLATSGVTVLRPLPVAIGDLAPGSTFEYGLVYHVPYGVTLFKTTTFASCEDNGGNLYEFPAPFS